MSIDEQGPSTVRNKILTVEWGIGRDLQGMSGVAVRRAAALARRERRVFDVLTLDGATDVETLQERVVRQVVGGDRVKIHNIWNSIGEWSDREIATLCPSATVQEEFPEPLDYEGATQSVIRDGAGKVSRVDHFRDDGSRWCTDLRRAVRDDGALTRLITTFDREGSVVGRWTSPSRFYFSWIDRIVGPGGATLVTDSDFVGSFLHKFDRTDLRLIHVLHRFESAGGSGDGEIVLSSAQRKILKHASGLTTLAVTSPADLDVLRGLGGQGVEPRLALLPDLDAGRENAAAYDLWRGVLDGRAGAEQVAEAREAMMSDAERLRAFMSDPVDDNLIHWESTHGSGALCNPEAMFREAMGDPAYDRFKHVWTLSAAARQSAFAREFSGHPRVQFVERKSREYWRYVCTAKYLINNTTYPFSFSKRPAQVYVNTWHGTPLKKMGYDVRDGAQLEQNACRNFALADYLIAQNSYMADYMYLEAHRLRGLFDGAIVEEGYPRSDHMFRSGSRDALKAAMSKKGVPIGDRKIALYAPTWRGSSNERPRADADMLHGALVAMREGLDPEEWVVLIKAHKINYSQLSRDARFSELCVPHELQANVVLGGVDLMVADYSSIYIDFLATRKPIVFYLPDVEDYRSRRGLYFDEGELPGPVAYSTAELSECMRAVATEGLRRVDQPAFERYEALVDRFTPRDDGRASRRVLDIVLDRKEEGYAVRRGHGGSKPRALIYAGNFESDSVNASLFLLLASIDRTRVDVTVLYERTTSERTLKIVRRLPADVRQVIRAYGVLRPELRKSLRRLRADGLSRASREEIRAADSELWQAEWRRFFGDISFDLVLDLGGDSTFYSRFLLEAETRARLTVTWSDGLADGDSGGSRPREYARAYSKVIHVDDRASVEETVESIHESMERQAVAVRGRSVKCNSSEDVKVVHPARSQREVALR